MALIIMGGPTPSVTKTGRLIMCTMRHIHSKPVTTEHFLCKQIKKVTGWLEDISWRQDQFRTGHFTNTQYTHRHMHSEHSNAAELWKCTADTLYLMASQDVPWEVIHPRTHYEECPKPCRKWNKDQVKSDKLETRNMVSYIIIGMSNIGKQAKE